ncbi:hypothetical protein VNO77_44167 [Canavalia gladiata]|uniref:Uncharacterized protein n=1 Tax=Canavalia gladiata TaxID=3824 RepID=A0AAN9JY17_CANGL
MHRACRVSNPLSFEQAPLKQFKLGTIEASANLYGRTIKVIILKAHKRTLATDVLVGILKEEPERDYLKVAVRTVEGFPFDLLMNGLRNTSIQRTMSNYFEVMENFDEASLAACSSDLCGVSTFILSAPLQSLQ